MIDFFPDSDFSGSDVVEIDPGDAVVVFVRAPDRRAIPNAFHPDDQICLVMPQDIADFLFPS